MIVVQDIRSVYTSGRPVTLSNNVTLHNNGSYIQGGGNFLMGHCLSLEEDLKQFRRLF